MSRSFDALGFDPAPGDLGPGHEMARTMREVARTLGEIDAVVHGEGDQQWRGQAAEAFRSLMGEDFAPRIREAHLSFSAASRALDGWVGSLAGFQARAAALEAQAERARADLARNGDALAGLGPVPPDPDAAREHEARRGQLDSAVRTSRTELDEVLRQARSLAEEASTSAATTAAALDTAVRAAPDEPGLWDKLTDVVADIGTFLADVIEFVRDNWWDILHKLVAVAVVVLAVAALLVPGVGWLATAALIAAIADTAMSGVDWLVLDREGAREAFLLGAAGLGAGAALGAVARAAAPTVNAALRQGPFMYAIQGGRASVAAPATVALSVNSLYTPALGGYVMLRWKESTDTVEGVRGVLGGNTYYDDDLRAGWARARGNR